MVQYITDERRRIIQSQARNFNLELWNNRHTLWKSNIPSCPLEAIDPGVALGFLGFEVINRLTNGEAWKDGKRSEPLGIINCATKKVYISNRFEYQKQRYTLAHELGHAVLKHSLEPLHRDMDINEFGGRRNIFEQEADAFAGAFLMPEKPLRAIFTKTFGLETFVLNEDSAFYLCSSSLCDVQEKYRTKRALSRALANTITYGRKINSLKSQFDVSTTVMAIRLEELELVA
jgi:hypothetical protein